MKFPYVSRPKFGRDKIYAILLLPAVLLSANSTGLAKGGVTTPPARPVARLLSTSEQVRPPSRVPATRVKPSAATTTSSYASSSNAATAAASGDERRVFDLVNDARKAKGARPLTWDADLVRLARLHAGNMAQQGFFDHIGRDGLSAVQRADRLGIRGWRALGENIAYNEGFDDPAAFAVERWMQSSQHRDNILNSMFTHTGLGVARATDGRIFFTQVFVRR